MTTAHKVTVGLVIALTLLLGFVGYGWLTEHEAGILISAQQKADANAQVKLEQQQAANQALLDAKLKSLDNMRVTVQTPIQIVKALPEVISLPSAISQVSDAQAAAANVAALPDGVQLHGGDLVIPKESAKTFFDAQVQCKANEAKLDTCGQQVQTLQAIGEVKDQQIKELNIALKGGTKWQRTLRALKFVGIGAGIGAGAVAYLAVRK